MKSKIKTFVLLAILATTLTGIAYAQYRQQCYFIKKDGNRCMNWAKEGSAYCSTHNK